MPAFFAGATGMFPPAGLFGHGSFSSLPNTATAFAAAAATREHRAAGALSGDDALIDIAAI